MDTPDNGLADPQQTIADLKRQLAASNAERDEALEQQTATAEVLQVINSSPGDLAPVFDAMLERAVRLCEAAHGYLYIYDGQRFAPLAMRGDTTFADWLRKQAPIVGMETTPHGRIAQGERFVHIVDVLQDAAYRNQVGYFHEACNRAGTRTFLAVSLRKDDALLGTIHVYRREVRPFSKKQIALLQNFAAQAVIAIENARLITETHEALEQQTATAEVLGVINASPGDLAPVFNAILEKAHTWCGADHGALVGYDGETFRAIATRGVSRAFDEYLRRGFPFFSGTFADQLMRGEPVHILDLPAAATQSPPELARLQQQAAELAGTRTLLMVPLCKDSVLRGYIAAYRTEVRPFTEKQIALLQNFATQAVIAMENARLITETRQALEQQTATAEVLEVINSSPGDLQPVFDAMLEKACGLCEAAFGTLLVYEGGRFNTVAVRNVPEAYSKFVERERPVHGPGTGPARILEGERIVHIVDLMAEEAYQSGDPNRSALVDLAGARSLVAVPLLKNDLARGIITIFRQEVRPFTDKEIALLQNFAAQAVIAIENARLLTETQEALEQQTATADVLQVINSSPGNLKPVFDAILERAHALFSVANGTLQLFDGECFHAVATRGMPERFTELLREPYAPDANTPPGRLIAGDRLCQISDTAELVAQSIATDLRSRMAAECGVRTVLFVPLRKSGALVGMITAGRQEVRLFTDKEITLLENFAAQAVIAMESARLLTETREALDQQTATAEVLEVINSSPGDLLPVFNAMLEKAMRLCGATFGELRTYDGKGFQTAATRGVPTAYAEYRRLHASATGNQGGMSERIREGERVIHIVDLIDDRYRAGHANRRALVDLGGARTALLVALSKGAALFGAIMIYRQEVRPFTDQQVALLQNFAAQAVVAMENARLLTETREALDQQTATAEVLGVINSSPGDLEPVFDAILEKARSLCGAVHGALVVYDGEHFRAVATHGLPERIEGLLRTPFRPNPVHQALLQGERLIHIADQAAVTTNTEIGRASVDAGARTLLLVPLRKDDALLGYITASRWEVRPFSEKEIALLENFAAQAVIAIENARLLDELRQRTEEVAQLNRGLEARVAEQVEELGRVGRLKRFLAPQLAEMIVSQGDEKILESHRREIVVVFCDLRGYTAFTETAEPEEVLDFLREYHGALGPLVSQFEGTLDQFSGDGIMVFFNDPVPIPDPAERAVNMAVAMREVAGSLTVAWRERGRELGFGAGIAQGYATLGQIGFSERSGYTAIGTVCNVAARLCAEAKDGQILLSQRVNVALKGSVPTEQMGALALKGLTQPVIAYNVPTTSSQPALRVIEGGPPSD